MKSRDILAVFNRGLISDLAVARTDVSRVALSASVMTNWMPRTLGAMSLRPGLGYKGNVIDDGAYLPFVFSNADKAILELSPGKMRVWEDGDSLLVREEVNAAVANPDFATDLTDWDDADESGAASSWSSGSMKLVGTGYSSARRRQLVDTTSGENSRVHALRIEVSRGPVLLRIGSTAGADDVFRQAVLRTGTHSIAFAPGGDFHIEFSSALKSPVLIDSCTLESSGTVEIDTPWLTIDDCKAVRWQQSSDVIFAACRNMQQRRVERRPNGSWSVVTYETRNGPFLSENTENITLTPSAISGEITIDASRPVFQAGHVGGIYSLTSQGQIVEADLTGELTYTGEIRVTGVEDDRKFQVTRAGTWVGTVSLQRSLGAPGSWVTVATYTDNGSLSYDDELDNSIAFYRIGFEAGNYTSGTAEVALEFSAGSISGVVRVTDYTSDTSVGAIVLKDLGGTDATEIWAEGAWSDAQGWPTATVIADGRLWWFGQGRSYGSVSDAFTNFDPNYEGDAAPINRRVGEGASNEVNWALALQRLIAGADDAEHSIRSNSFDEPITPSNYNSKVTSTKGSAAVPAIAADGRGYFISKCNTKLYELEYDSTRYDFASLDMTLLRPEIGLPRFKRVAVQQFPDLRIHCVRGDGTAGVMVRDAAEDVLCWIEIETLGEIEDVVVLPGDIADRVFYRVSRTINGVTMRFHEEWAREDECVGGAVNKQADAFVVGSGLVNGLSHLEGKSVVVWADGADIGSHVVSGGELPGSYADWVVGLPYEARYQSAKLAGQTSLGLSLTQRTRIDHLGLILGNTHAQGLQYGPSFDVLDDMPMYEDGGLIDADSVWESYDKDMIEFPGEWSTDNRICLKATAPRPCTVLAAVLSVDRQDKA